MNAADTFDDVVSRLSSQSEVIFTPPNSKFDRLIPAIKTTGISFETRRLDLDAYKAWRQQMDYASNYPAYVKEFPEGPLLFKKSVEHYWSLLVSPPEPHHVFVDVASSNSVLPDILRRHYGLTEVYRQDLRFPPGINEWKIGSNAASIPLPDNSVDRMTLHCSMEHFEDFSDTAFVREAARLLRPGGTVCVTPLYIAEMYFIMTSRIAWKTQGIPDFDPRAIVYINDPCKLRYAKHFDPWQLKEQILKPAEDAGLSWQLINIENWRDQPKIPIFTLLLTK